MPYALLLFLLIPLGPSVLLAVVHAYQVRNAMQRGERS